MRGLKRKTYLNSLTALTTASRASLNGLVNTILRTVANINAKRIVIDSIAALLKILGEDGARAFLHSVIINGLKPLNVTAYLVADLPYGVSTVGYGFEEFLVDAVLKLTVDESRGKVRRFMAIHKVRDSPTPRVSYEFEITHGGIYVYLPLEIGVRGSIKAERLSTGIGKLDEMFRGGLLKASLTLISGPSGAGKTILSMMFALAGALNGENVIYISFEESIEQLKTLLRSLGYNPDKLEEQLKLFKYTPRVQTPGKLYHLYSDVVEKHNPSRIIIDGSTALERYYTRDEFLELLGSMITLSKVRGITCVITSSKDVMSGEVSDVSTMVDNIIALWFSRNESTINRMIAILKQRGSDHDKTTRKLDFKGGKVIID